nr:retrovirus-related Pol polyprotein from transposon TNT 1-94 [Tanacetum cinerariifolium]
VVVMMLSWLRWSRWCWWRQGDEGSVVWMIVVAWEVVTAWRCASSGGMVVMLVGRKSAVTEILSDDGTRSGEEYVCEAIINMGNPNWQFCDSDLEVAFRQHTCFIRNLEGVDLLTGSRGNNLYTLSLQDMMASSPICLLSKASKTKSWLWHHRLLHLNFGAINHLARQGLIRGLLKLKFEKDHLCSACAMGKSTNKSHKPKSEDTNQEKLYLLHMDLYGPMRVESVNGKKYILVIVDDYSRFTWVKFLRSKDETPMFIIKFLKMIQLRQNGVVERRNQTLIEAARTMLIYAQAPLFLWAEAVATACFTQNRSIIRLRHGKTPYELMHGKQSDLSYFMYLVPFVTQLMMVRMSESYN